MKIDVSSKIRRLKAFTLVELIIVIAILTVLTLIAVPNTISMIRTSRIESANTQAKEIHTAVQNFATDMQIKNKKLANTASDKNGVFPQEAVGTSKDKIIFAACGNDSGVLVFDETLTKTLANVDMGDTLRCDKEVSIISNLEKYLGDAFEGIRDLEFTAQIDINTYTVDWVVYSEQPTSDKDIVALVQNYQSTHKLYESCFGSATGKFTSQEWDANHRDSTFNAYIGQYPIPYAVR